MTALDNAIRAAGSANKLASTIGVSGMAVSQWKAKGTVPSSRVLQVFDATGVTGLTRFTKRAVMAASTFQLLNSMTG